MKWILMIPLMMLLSGCLGSRVDFSDLGTGAGAVIAAGVATSVGLPPLATIATTAIGATAGAVLVDEPESVVDQLEALPEEDRAQYAQWLSVIELLRSLGYYAIGAVLAFFLLPMLLGYFIPNGKQRRQKREMIQMKEALFDNPNITMKDLR